MYQSFIGLEVHIQLTTRSKAFCACANRFGDEPNTNVCPVCMGYPGVLPAVNEDALRMGYLVARALDCELAPLAVFDRKNYFYPDMPKNYQISQFARPIGRGGRLELEFRGKTRQVRIHEVHLEEDAGKMIHAGDMSLLDYNRAGTPLLEVVTDPDMEIGEEAEVLLLDFRRMVRYLGVCDGNMEEGSLRCDANVSINLRGAGLGRKVEIKNLNSSRFVRKALNFEIARQEEILRQGGTVVQETRLWNENRDVTESMRRKESAHDYRYFPEPDLPPFRPDQAFLKAVESNLVELPRARKERFKREYGLSEDAAEFLVDEKRRADFFETSVSLAADPASAATWLASDVKKVLNRDSLELGACPLSEKRFAELLGLLASGRIHGKIAKQVLEAVFSEDKDPAAIIRDKGWEQITDRASLEPLIERVLAAHAQLTAAIRAGDPKSVTFLVGQIMKETTGRAEPRLVQAILKEKLALSYVQVFSFGGAITGARAADGTVSAGEAAAQKELAASLGLAAGLRFDELKLAGFLSEEITPEDWAVLLAAVEGVLAEGSASGLVITHGTDTLAYTAGLLHWLFPSPRIPIVLTAASAPHGEAGSDAAGNFKAAVARASVGPAAVCVVFGGVIYPALNLKLERVNPIRFTTWNEAGLGALRAGGRPAIDLRAADLKQRIEAAVSATFVAKVYPGMQGDSLIALMKAGVRHFILEVFDTGTANLRQSPFSLKKAFAYGRETGVAFFCTSQQEGTVDFSEYVTAHELWKEGAVPMGSLTTESAYAKLIAAQLSAETSEQLLRLMET